MLLRLLVTLILPLQLFAITLVPNPPVPILPSTIQGRQSNPSVAGIGTTYMAVWNDTTTLLTFSITTDNGATWSTPQSIPVPNDITTSPVIAANSSGFVVAWIDISTGFAPGKLLTTFTGNLGATWSSPVAIVNTGAYPNPSITATSSGFMVTWENTTTMILSSFSSNGTSWSNSTVDIDGVNQVAAYPNITGIGTNFMITWPSSTGNAYSAFSSNNGATWDPKNVITNPVPSSTNTFTVIPAVTAGGYLATFQNGSGSAFSSFSSNNGNTWSTPTLITTGLATVNTPAVPVVGTPFGYLVTGHFADNSVQASITSNNGATWNPFVNISAAYPIDTVRYSGAYLAYGSEGVMAVWIESGTENVISDFIPLASPVQPPSNLTARNQINRFPFQDQYYVCLCWEASSTSDVTYQIYRDGTLIATTDSLCYADQSIKRHTTYDYTVFAVDASGNKSLGISVTVTVP